MASPEDHNIGLDLTVRVMDCSAASQTCIVMLISHISHSLTPTSPHLTATLSTVVREIVQTNYIPRPHIEQDELPRTMNISSDL